MIWYKKIISIVCSAMIFTVSLCACETVDEMESEEITLVDPVGVTENYECVARRDMYQADVYSSSVNPIVTEYAFSKDQVFQRYGAIPGQQVAAGDTLVYSETKSLDKQIEDLANELEDLERNHDIDTNRLKKDLENAIKSEDDAYESYIKIKRDEPDYCTPAHDMWEDQVRWPEYSYKMSVQHREKVEENQKQNNELYEVEHKHLIDKKQNVIDKVIDTTVITNTDGEIVACNFFANGDVIPKDIPVLAVGDTSVKVLKTDYIPKGTINKALEVYAIIDGERYELQYVNMEPEEYQQLVDEDESVYTSFILEDPENQVEYGNYAAVVIEKDRRKNVLSVPNDALKKESDGYYVYRYDEGESSYIKVELGMRDGMYSEVISGLSEGDKVLSTDVAKAAKNTGTVTRGDYSIEMELNGFLYYPFSEWIVNPAQNGTTYLKEILVSENEKVEEDQVIATIEVVPDQIEVNRLSTQIARLESRLAELNVTKAACDAKELVSYDLNIKISENERDTKIKRRELQKLNKYSGIVELKAPYSGEIMEIESIKPGEILEPDAKLVEMAKDSMSYIIVKDEKNQLNYGNSVDITVSSMSGPVTLEGKVATVSNACLSKKMVNDFSLIAVSNEQLSLLDGSVLLDTGRWDRNNYKVSVKSRSEKNVLIVPKMAVTNKDKSTYVTVVKQDGTVERRNFIPGGSDNNYYWIVDGLSEGLTVCWE